jgi:hypothetical protein
MSVPAASPAAPDTGPVSRKVRSARMSKSTQPRNLSKTYSTRPEKLEASKFQHQSRTTKLHGKSPSTTKNYSSNHGQQYYLRGTIVNKKSKYSVLSNYLQRNNNVGQTTTNLTNKAEDASTTSQRSQS